MKNDHPVFDLMIESIRRDGTLPSFGTGVDATFVMPIQCAPGLPPHIKVAAGRGYSGNAHPAIVALIQTGEPELIWDAGEEVKELLAFLADQNIEQQSKSSQLSSEPLGPWRHDIDTTAPLRDDRDTSGPLRNA